MGQGLIIAALGGALLVSGCASMSKKDCLEGDWAARGFEDGREGRPLEQFSRHVEACAKVDVMPDEGLYRQAFERGTLEYCTPERGYTEGTRDRDYHGICPPELERAFLQPYLDGLEEKLARLDQDYERARGDLESDRVRRASLGEKATSKELERSIDYGESRVLSLSNDRREVRTKISRWRRQL